LNIFIFFSGTIRTNLNPYTYSSSPVDILYPEESLWPQVAGIVRDDIDLWLFQGHQFMTGFTWERSLEPSLCVTGLVSVNARDEAITSAVEE